jgi:hypothetical protein
MSIDPETEIVQTVVDLTGYTEETLTITGVTAKVATSGSNSVDVSDLRGGGDYETSGDLNSGSSYTFTVIVRRAPVDGEYLVLVVDSPVDFP